MANHLDDKPPRSGLAAVTDQHSAHYATPDFQNGGIRGLNQMPAAFATTAASTRFGVQLLD
jgi:hypothetical protein